MRDAYEVHVDCRAAVHFARNHMTNVSNELLAIEPRNHELSAENKLALAAATLSSWKTLGNGVKIK